MRFPKWESLGFELVNKKAFEPKKPFQALNPPTTQSNLRKKRFRTEATKEKGLSVFSRRHHP